MTSHLSSYLKQFAYLNRQTLEEQNESYQTSISKVPKISQLGSEDIEHLNHLYNSLVLLDNIMFPFKDCKIPFELGVTGGAVYDLLTNNTSLIKDYDITLHFPIYPQHDEFEIMNKQFTTDNISFTGKNFDLLSQQYQTPMHNLFKKYLPEKAIGTYLPKDLTHLVKAILKANYTTVNQLGSKADIKSYRNDQINAIFQIEDSNFLKPIDLIMNKCNTNYFCSTFDFNVCKTYINYKPNINENMTKEAVAEHMLQNLFIFPEAAKDLHHQTLTMDLIHQTFNLDNIIYFMERHFPRLEEKLPHYRLSFKTNENTIVEQKQWTDSYWHDYLERKLPHISQNKNKPKYKI